MNRPLSMPCTEIHCGVRVHGGRLGVFFQNSRTSGRDVRCVEINLFLLVEDLK